MDGGGGTTTVAPAPMPQQELDLIGMQTQLAQQQLGAAQAAAPLNQQLINQASQQLTSQNAYQTALDAAISPQQQAQAAATQFQNAGTLSNDQIQLAQMQLAQLQAGPGATPQEQQQIAQATQAAETAGVGDINTQTQQGLNMISDQLANSRGLRLSDSPIGSEAALLEQQQGNQISSLVNNLAANQANATLNYPLAVQGLQSSISSNQQNSNAAFQAFQSQLQQQAATNRLALTGPAITSGLGLASGNPAGSALGAFNNGSTTTAPLSLSGLGQLGSGIGAVGGLFSGSGATAGAGAAAAADAAAAGGTAAAGGDALAEIGMAAMMA